jgi:hypothetical protein
MSQLDLFATEPPPKPKKVRKGHGWKYFEPYRFDRGPWPAGGEGRWAPHPGAVNDKGIATSGYSGPTLTWEEAFDLVERLEKEQKTNSPLYLEALRELNGWGSGFYRVL